MANINLRIADLRKQKNLSQQKLAELLGVSFQTISKWENKITMPDITMLPEISKVFSISVDMLLGLEPLPGEEYTPSMSGKKNYWSSKLNYLKKSRKYMWNNDYISFLIKDVWKIDKPVSVLDCGCGYGFLANVLMNLLPEKSHYTGIDFNEELLNTEKNLSTQNNIEFICDDFFKYETKNKYDIVICHMVLRHLDNPREFISKMIQYCNKGGLVICIDVNREIESSGLYINGMDYDELCSKEGFHKMWKHELEMQGRDYSISMKIPRIMEEEGLRNIEARMNDKVNILLENTINRNQVLDDFIEIKDFNKEIDESEIINYFINHGMNREEAEKYCIKEKKIKNFIEKNRKDISYTSLNGSLIVFGWK